MAKRSSKSEWIFYVIGIIIIGLLIYGIIQVALK
jgi:hypothetical protein